MNSIMPQTNSALQPGIAIQGKKNSYIIESTLGQGTFGITYLAKYKTKIQGEMGIGQATVQVAIKEFFMKELNQRDPETSSLHDDSNSLFIDKYRRSFIREAHKMARLSDPNITHVFEVIEANNTAYIVMEFIEGGNLDDYIRQQGHLSEKEALTLFVDIAHAIEYMHSKKMLHLDLKPKNIMLDEDGRCHIIDFGLSKEYNENGEAENDTTIGLGTPGYAPIEQCERQDGGIFAATIDVYALGGTLYKMLTGTTPPKASTILNKPDLVASNLCSYGINRQTIKVIEQAMQPAALNRFQTVGDMLKALDVDASDTIERPKGKKHVEMVTDLPPEPDTTVDPVPSKNGTETVEIKLQKKWIIGVAICLACTLLTFLGINYGPKLLGGGDNGGNGGTGTDTIPPIVTPIEETPATDYAKKHDENKESASGSETNPTNDNNSSIGTNPTTPTAPPTGSGTKNSSGTLDLGYATWTGETRNDKPHGQGTMTYKASLPLNDEGKNTAEPGDVITGECENGRWVNFARWTSKSTGKTIKLTF